MLVFIFTAVALLFQLSQAATVIVDGVSQWNNPHLLIGDSVVFHHKYNYSLYIFKNQNAFSSCNFTQATLLTKPSSTSYTWHVSRPGFFYFSFNNGSNKACLEGQKFAVNVSSPTPRPSTSPQLAPPQMPAPAPSSGGFIASSPVYPWPFLPREESRSPSPAPGLADAALAPYTEGIPFINSSPAIPLPTGEIDSATIRPLPTTSGHQHSKQVMVLAGVHRALSCATVVLITFSLL